MDLLTAPWVPTQGVSGIELVRLMDVLCTDADFHIALPRDDMEMACLQLLICLTQVLFEPEDVGALKRRVRSHLTQAEYEAGIEPFEGWFDLCHPQSPFMQALSVKAEEVTPIQKLFVGLPEGNNHAFFNEPGEISAVCLPAAAVLLFNQAMNCPSFGGGFKAGFRGSAPITTLMAGDTLRKTIWFNVLHKQSILGLMANYDELKANDKPTWVEQIPAKSKIPAQKIGWLRGLFWQPGKMELITSNGVGRCEFYGIETDVLVTGFKKEKFVYDIVGEWVHPHSPRIFNITDHTNKYLSFTTTEPAWTKFSRFLFSSKGDKANEKIEPASTIKQYRSIATNERLRVGGYRNKQASILQRRHEVLSLGSGWNDGKESVEMFVGIALQIKAILRNKLYGFAQASGAANIHRLAEASFYNNSEPMIHELLREMDWREATAAISRLQTELIQLSRRIFDQLTAPYSHQPKMLKALAVARAGMEREFHKIQGERA